MTRQNQLEIACFNADSAFNAALAGVDRIELCAQIEEGGTTPLWDTIVDVRERCPNIPIYVMIRPRGGDFCYNEDEFEQMKNDIVMFKRLGVHGYVLGILNTENEIDIERNAELVSFAAPFPCTFHRAFDRTKDVFKSMETLINIGFQTILTSGGVDIALHGIDNLAALIKQADGRICIMPGGGLRSSNLAQIQTQCQASFYHSSAIVDATQIASIAEMKSLLSLLQ
jgi:copper homeostasis protein